MSTLRNILLLVATANLISACALFSKAREENLNQIQVGQSQDEVIAALGQPAERSPAGSSELWYYDVMSRDERSVYPYTGVFKEGKLTSWYFDTARVGNHSGSSQARRGSKGSQPTGP